MLPLMARADMPYVAMHWRGHAADMQANAVHDDVVTDVVDEPRLRIEAASQAGIRPGRLIIDPGLGFAMESGHNGELLGRLGDIVALGRPVLVGASRKSFLGRLLADPVTGQPRPARLRDAATTAVSVLAAAQGAWCLRVHDCRLDARRGAGDGPLGRRGGGVGTVPRIVRGSARTAHPAADLRRALEQHGRELVDAFLGEAVRGAGGAQGDDLAVAGPDRGGDGVQSVRIPDAVSTSARSCAGRWASRTLPLDVACTGVS
jgi:hypothetical protein